MSEMASKVIRIAEGEIGYLEKKSSASLDDKTSNAGSGNYTKYARDLDAVSWFNGRKQGSAWCAVFITWCFYQALGKSARSVLFQPAKDNCAAGCGYARKYYNKAGFLSDNPMPGDQIFFWSSDGSTVSHTGLVVDIDSERVYTVEGNTSGGTSVVANGGAVCAKSYPLGYKRIAGYGRPDWSKAEEPEQDTAETAVDYALQVWPASGETVNLRSGPGEEYSRLTAVPIGMCVAVSQEAGDWIRCTYDAPNGKSYTGYMMRRYLREPVPDEPVSQAQQGTAPAQAAVPTANIVTIDRTKLQELRACLVNSLSVINQVLGIKE